MVNLALAQSAAAALLPLLAAADQHTTAPFPARTFAECQRKTLNPLQGCPAGTLFVSATHPKAAFTSVQGAIASLPNGTSPHVVLVGAGNYTEQLNVTRPGPLYLLGQSDRPSRGRVLAAVGVGAAAQNDVQVWWSSANHDAVLADNVYTGVLTVGPTLDATLTGSGPTGFPVPGGTPFGCSDFRAYNIDFRNEFASYSDGPAHALGVSRANTSFYSCGFYSWQDTVYVGKLGNAYFYDTITAGQTDFLYGFGTLYITRSTLSLRSCGGGITAWKGTNTTAFANKYGVYLDSTQAVAANATIGAARAGRCALGRPWNAQQRSVFMASYLGGMVRPGGYVEWSASEPRVGSLTFMATWRDYGPGWNETAERASGVTRVLSDAEVRPYRWPADVFITPEGRGGNVGWIDRSVLVGPRGVGL